MATTNAKNKKNKLLKVVTNSDVVEGLKSKGAISIAPGQLWIEKGYNIRELCEDHINGFVESYKSGLFVPPIEVVEFMVGNELKYKVIEGHHRTVAINKAIELGYSCEQIEVLLMEGDEVSQFVRMIQSSQGRKLNQIEMAHAYNRLISYGLNQVEVAEQLSVTPAQVSNYLQLLKAPALLQAWIKTGKYSATKAHNMIRKHGADIAMAIAVEDMKVKAEREKERKKGVKVSRTRSSALSSTHKLNETTVDDMSGLISEVAKHIPEGLDVVEGKVKVKVSPEIASALSSLSLRVFSVSNSNQKLESQLHQKAQSLKTRSKNAA